VQGPITFATEALRTGNRVVGVGLAAIIAILLATAMFLLLSLPDANAFNQKVERIFIENDDLTSQAEIKLLEILAESGTAFSETCWRLPDGDLRPDDLCHRASGGRAGVPDLHRRAEPPDVGD
jgi:hypothetical protein